MRIIETERLLIRSWRESDGEYYQIMSRDTGYNRFAPPGFYLVKDANELREKLRQRISLFDSRALGKFPVFLKESGEFVGTCGFDPYVVEGNEEFELGYRMCLAHWGKGFATEASRGLLDYGFKKLRLKRIIAFAAPQNSASLKVIGKLEFDPVGEIMHAGIKHLLFEKRAR